MQSLLKQRADILRVTHGAQDSYGQPTESYELLAYQEPCRIQALSTKDIAGLSNNSGSSPVIDGQVVTHKGFFMMRVAIGHKDKISVDTKNYLVAFANKDVAGAGHHQECLLSEVV